MMTQTDLEAGVKRPNLEHAKDLQTMTCHRLVSDFQAKGAIIRKIQRLFCRMTPLDIAVRVIGQISHLHDLL